MTMETSLIHALICASVVFPVVVVVVVFPVVVVGDCSADGLTAMRTQCITQTGYDETTCQNLDCFLVCVEQFLSDCQTLDQFHSFDPVVFRVRERVVCNDQQGFRAANLACQQMEFHCTIARQIVWQQLFMNASTHLSLNDFERYKNASCSMYTINRECTRVVAGGACTEDMASLMNQLLTVQYTYSACSEPQDSPLFLQFGDPSVCDTGDGEDADVTTVTPSVSTTTAPLSSPSSSGTATVSSITQTTTTDLSQPTMLPGDSTETTGPSLGTSNTAAATTTTTTSASTTTNDVIGTTTTLSAGPTTEDPVFTMDIIRGPIPQRCERLELVTKMEMDTCDLQPFALTAADNEDFCNNEMECNLQCYDYNMQDCDKYTPVFSKLRRRLYHRMICNFSSSGMYKEYLERWQYCVSTECYIVYRNFLRATQDWERACVLLAEFEKCETSWVTDQCPQWVVDMEKQLAIASYDYCRPDRRSWYDQFKHDEYDCDDNSAVRYGRTHWYGGLGILGILHTFVVLISTGSIAV